MTNILDTVNKSKAKLEDLLDEYWGIAFTEGTTAKSFGNANNTLHKIRETVESLLAEHRKQVLLEGAAFCDDQYERDKPLQEAGGQDNSDGYVTGYVEGCGDCGHGLRLMAEGDKHE